MSIFSRVKTESAKDLSDLATMQGLEHTILPFAGRFSEWTTFQFTSDNSKHAFDRIAKENGYTLEGSSVTRSMLDAVLDGESPEDVIDEAITPGMKRAYTKNGSGRSCPECGLTIPKYPGGYPKKCPECGTEIVNGN